MSFKYKVYHDHVAIQRYLGRDRIVSIPNTIENLPVTVISSFAFAGNTAVQFVILPDLLITIRENAFYGCAKLRVLLPQAMYTVQKSCISGVAILPALTKSIMNGAFTGCDRLTHVYFHGYTEFEDKAFSPCVSFHYPFGPQQPQNNHDDISQSSTVVLLPVLYEKRFSRITHSLAVG